jgi:polar amino acid transport system substrate-binding protein
LALNKAVPDEVVAKLQKALEDMRAEGKVDEIMGRYL